MYSKCFVWPYKQIMNAFYTILTFHFKLQILYACNSPVSADENQLEGEKVRFFFEMYKINS